ncbi:MAG: cell division protein FtsL [Deltaproteobacteria bacterium]|jgi:cell division protein FtsL|nr:cell division protein FtsL [Deltaproteobacteria bacterium]
MAYSPKSARGKDKDRHFSRPNRARKEKSGLFGLLGRRESRSSVREKVMASRKVDPSETSNDVLLDPSPDDRPQGLPPNRFWGVIVLSSIVVLCLILLVSLEIRHIGIGREVSRLSQRRNVLSDENLRLKSELDSIMEFQELETAARDSLGMAPPQMTQIVTIR